MPSLVDVFVQAHNRPDYLEEMLQSLKNADLTETQVIVSDNSTNEENRKLAVRFEGFEFRYRRPSVDARTHFEIMVSEARADYFMVVHDDDAIDPDLIQRLKRTLDLNHDLIAVAANARIIGRPSSSPKELFAKNLEGERTQRDPGLFFRSYFTQKSDVFPFPAYMYRTQRVKELAISIRDAGKYSDVSFLTTLVAAGPIRQINEGLYVYRIHGTQDSGSYSIAKTKQLMTWARKRGFADPDEFQLKKYRITQILAEMPPENRWRISIARRALIALALRHPLKALRIAAKKISRRFSLQLGRLP